MRAIITGFLSALIQIPATVLFIVPGIYLYVRLSVSYFVAVLENQSAEKNIERSWKLTKGLWWPVFISLIVPSFLLNEFIVLVSGLIALGLGANAPQATYSIVSGTLWWITYPLSITYFAVLYKRLVLRHSNAVRP